MRAPNLQEVGVPTSTHFGTKNHPVGTPGMIWYEYERIEISSARSNEDSDSEVEMGSGATGFAQAQT